MPKVKIKKHDVLCPEEKVLVAEKGDNLCQLLLNNGIDIEHACEMSRACTTCHVIIQSGYESVEQPDEDEEDLLDRAWGLKAESRLSCQVIVQNEDLEVEIPRYTINHARE